jgi:hypothetical protein
MQLFLLLVQQIEEGEDSLRTANLLSEFWGADLDLVYRAAHKVIRERHQGVVVKV